MYALLNSPKSDITISDCERFNSIKGVRESPEKPFKLNVLEY